MRNSKLAREPHMGHESFRTPWVKSSSIATLWEWKFGTLCERVEHWAHAAVRESVEKIYDGKTRRRAYFAFIDGKFILWVIFFYMRHRRRRRLSAFLLIKRSLEPMQTLTLSLKQHTSRQTFPISQILPHISTENFLFVSVYFFPSFFVIFSLPLRRRRLVFRFSVLVSGADISQCQKADEKGKRKTRKRELHFHEISSSSRSSTAGGSVKKKNVCYLVAFFLWDFLSTLWARLQTIHKVLGSFSLYGTLSTKTTETHLHFNRVDALLWQNIVERKVQATREDSIWAASCSVGREKQERFIDYEEA